MRSFYPVLALVLAALSAPLRAQTILTFDVASHTEAAKGGEPAKSQSLPKDASYPLTVTLAGDALQLDEPDTQRRLDFRTARLYDLDKRNHTYQEFSLYTILGFNVEEFANRMTLGKSLAAAKVPADMMAPALTEHLMSLSDPANATAIDRTTRDGQTTYSWSGHTLMTVSQKTREVPADVLREYLRFLRYSTGGHPQILAAIAKGNGVPERLTVVRTNVNVETRTLTLRSIQEAPAATWSLADYRREVPDGEPYTTLKRLPATSAPDLAMDVDLLRHQRDDAAAAGHLFDAMLANIAVLLSVGDTSESGAWVAAHKDALNANADAQTLTRSLTPKDAASAAAAADALAKLRESAGPHRYVLEIFEANTRLALHQRAQAIDLFLAALAADPTITGAWIDLGTAYYTAFRPDRAWACWDAARALQPTHFMLKAVDDRERKLRTDHPEFF